MTGRAELVAALRHALSADRVHDGATELSLYRHDASHMEGAAAALCFPTSTDEVAACVRAAVAHGVPFVARGSGTGLAGGAVPPDGRGDHLDVEDEPAPVGRSRRPARLGRAWSAQPRPVPRRGAATACTSLPTRAASRPARSAATWRTTPGGPHCLSEGVTNAHILAVEVVLPDGTVTVLGGEDPEPPGYDLRGVFVGSEGMCGIATKVCVRLTPDPPAVTTLLADFDTVEAGASTVSDIIASGIVPAALEMMDHLCLVAVEAYIQAGLPTEAAAALLVEVVGSPHAVAEHTAAIVDIARRHGVRNVRIAADEAERALLWKGRKSAFGAIARIKPNYYLHDTVVPRHELPGVLAQVYEIARRHDLDVLNVFHAGDGNLHPLLLFDGREPGVMARVEAAGTEIVEASVAAGGVLSGEHGIGLEKRDLMPLMFSAVDLAAQAARPGGVRPARHVEPGQGPAQPGPLRRPAATRRGAWV